MVENQDLLRSVLRDPEQDQPRERYADWCVEQGDIATRARADFIRTQLAIAKTSRLANPESYLELRALERRLLASYRGAWGEPVRDRVSSYDFNRGFVELISVSAREFLERGEELGTLVPMAHLDITSIGEDAKEFFMSPLLERLQSLSVAQCGLRDRDVAVLSESPYLKGLRWLDLGDNQIGMDGAHALAQRTSGNLPRLRYVRFFGNPIDPSERYAHEHDRIPDRWLPPPGMALESEHGPLPWLHISGEMIEDACPNRFRISSRT